MKRKKGKKCRIHKKISSHKLLHLLPILCSLISETCSTQSGLNRDKYDFVTPRGEKSRPLRFTAICGSTLRLFEASRGGSCSKLIRFRSNKFRFTKHRPPGLTRAAELITRLSGRGDRSAARRYGIV